MKYHDIDFLRASDWHQCYQESKLDLPKPAPVEVQFTACQLALPITKRLTVFEEEDISDKVKNRTESVMAPSLAQNQDLLPSPTPK